MQRLTPIAFATALWLAAQTQPPLIRVTTHLVEVNVIVRDKDGPVKGLTAVDFLLFDKGKPQKISAFSMVALHGAAAGAPTGSTLPPNIFTNRPEARAAVPGSTTVVLLDGINTDLRDQAYAKKQFLRFLKQVRPEDRVAVYTLGTSLCVLHDFTSDARSLVAAVARHSGENLGLVDASNPGDSDSGDFIIDSWLNDSSGMVADNAVIDRARTTAAALEAIANHIARLPGRKNLVWVSGSFPFAIGHFGADGPNNWEDAAFDQQIAGGTKTKSHDISGPASTALYGVNLHDGNPARAQTNFDSEVRRATRALNDADISVYPVDARGLIALPANMTAQGSAPVSRTSIGERAVSQSMAPVGRNAMHAIADNTGGRVFDNTNDIEGAIRTAIDDSEVTYTLGFYPETKTLDAKFHELKVQVKRPGVEVRFRKGYLASPDVPATDLERGDRISAALSTTLEAAGISLKATAERVEQPKPGSVLVTVAIEPKDLLFEAAGGQMGAQFDIAFSPRAADGRDLGTTTQNMKVNLDPARYAAVMEQGITLTKTFEQDARRTEVRVVLFDRLSGKVGSLVIPGGGQ